MLRKTQILLRKTFGLLNFKLSKHVLWDYSVCIVCFVGLFVCIVDFVELFVCIVCFVGLFVCVVDFVGLFMCIVRLL